MGGLVSRLRGGIGREHVQKTAAVRSQEEAVKRTQMPQPGESESKADAAEFNQMLHQVMHNSLKQRTVTVSGSPEHAGSPRHNHEHSDSRLPLHDVRNLLAGTTSAETLRESIAPALDESTVTLAEHWASAVRVIEEQHGNITYQIAYPIHPSKPSDSSSAQSKP